MQQVWRKRWRNTAWFALGGLTLVLLISAIYKKNQKPSKGIEVTFKGDGNNFFIEEKGVIGLLKANGLAIGQPIEAIDLKGLEKTLKKDKWIANAELFFDKNQVLQVIVEEKTPVARIFTIEGSSFYIDSACRKLPLSEKLSARIPMFTSFPSGKATLSRPDSELLASAKELAMFIQADDFLKAQVAQIDITPDGFEMIPTVGNHIVVLGEGNDFQQKFDRLFSFYKQVWTKVGFEKYEKIDVRFDGQVVATVKGAKPAALVDSQKVRKAYESLVSESKKLGDPVLVQDDANKIPSKVSLAIAKKGSLKVKISRAAGTERREVRKEQLKQVVSNKQAEFKQTPKAIMRKALAARRG